MPDGPLKGAFIDPQAFKDAIRLYYEISGWDPEGKPPPGKLVEMGLEWLLDEEMAA